MTARGFLPRAGPLVSLPLQSPPMKRSIAIFMIVGVLVACEGFKQAMGSHSSVVAKAGTQELTVERLSALLSQAKVPVTADIAKAITNIWVDYELLGVAAAHNDSLTDTKMVDDALWPIISQMRAGKWHDVVAKGFHVDTSGGEAKFNAGEVLAARHILFHRSAGRDAGADRFDSQGRRRRSRAGDAGELHGDGDEVHAGARRRAARRRSRRVPEGRDGPAVRAGRRRAQAGTGLAAREDAVRLPYHPPLDVRRSGAAGGAAPQRPRAADRR